MNNFDRKTHLNNMQKDQIITLIKSDKKNNKTKNDSIIIQEGQILYNISLLYDNVKKGIKLSLVDKLDSGLMKATNNKDIIESRALEYSRVRFHTTNLKRIYMFADIVKSEIFKINIEPKVKVINNNYVDLFIQIQFVMIKKEQISKKHTVEVNRIMNLILENEYSK